MSNTCSSPTAVADLYQSHHDWLCGWLYRKVGNACDAADIAQSTFLRLLTRHHSVHLNEPRAYLATIARGLVVDHWRRRELEHAWLETLAAMPEPEAPSPETRLLFLVQDTDRALRFLARTQPIQVSYLTPYWVRVGPGEP
ncbi:hypothetical protein CKO35_16195 [Ectothiorhodospira shaposhnikovii]|uniref:sigma factor n=1 Tax=Ectothiorhodospira shaposhnikovii TaxID=1054 RepID=UPI0019038ED6|nr:hypothetical protein [Ectothiorhodospira shaposhnikovii]